MKRVIAVFLLAFVGGFAIERGGVPPKAQLSGENGGIVDGADWSSSMLRGKVTILFYVDPDKKDENNALSKALKAKHFDRKKYRSVAIVNLAATWMPDAVIEMKLSAKQKEFPDTVYVKDKKKVLVKKWGLKDDASDILLFDKNGKLIYKKFGKLNQKEIDQVIALIEERL
jgi:YtfJ family uncharacterized protein